MKNVFLSAFLVLALVANSFAVDKNKAAKKESGASYFAKNNFQVRFSEAKSVTWANVDNYYKASFTINGEKKSAFFDAQGEYVATTQYISADKLPSVSLQRIKKLYKDYSVGEVLQFEVDDSNESSYYFVSLRKATDQIVVKVSSSDVSYFKSL